eukprot:840867-Rhodomonas_salina.3
MRIRMWEGRGVWRGVEFSSAVSLELYLTTVHSPWPGPSYCVHNFPLTETAHWQWQALAHATRLPEPLAEPQRPALLRSHRDGVRPQAVTGMAGWLPQPRPATVTGTGSHVTVSWPGPGASGPAARVWAGPGCYGAQ